MICARRWHSCWVKPSWRMNYKDFRKLWINLHWSPATPYCGECQRRWQGQVSEVQLEINPSNQIVRIVLLESDGASTEFRFAGWKENVEMSDSRFNFLPPGGSRDRGRRILTRRTAVCGS